jgi:hypothetical protein
MSNNHFTIIEPGKGSMNMVSTYLEIGISYMNLEKYQEAEEYLLKSLKIQ